MYEVVIVEDDPMVAMINKQYVTENKHFHVASVCRDGDAALAYLTANNVQLVILDVYMPKTTGIEVLRRIREKNLPLAVIMVTAANDSAAIEEAVRLGVVDYLIKPFSSARFQQALENSSADRTHSTIWSSSASSILMPCLTAVPQRPLSSFLREYRIRPLKRCTTFLNEIPIRISQARRSQTRWGFHELRSADI